MTRHSFEKYILGILFLLLFCTACDLSDEIEYPAPLPTETTIAALPTSSDAIYYVAPDGDDDNPGTQDHPWQTIQKAADTLIAGDTVYIRRGTYSEQIEPQHSGAPNQPIIYAAYPGETPTLEGKDIRVREWGGLLHLYQVEHIALSGLRVINSTGSGIHLDGCKYITITQNTTYNTVSSGIGVWSSGHILVEGNEVELANNDGEQENITIAITHDFVVRDNHVHHGGPGSHGGEGIDIKDGSHDGVVYSNHVHDLDRVGIYVDAWDKHTYNIEVYNNVVHDIAAMGFSLASESGGLLENVHLYNNVAYNNQHVGIWFSGCCDILARTHPMRNIEISHNTLYGNGWASTGWGGGIGIENTDFEYIVIRNNLVSQNLYFQIGIDDPKVPIEELVIEYNLIDGYRGMEEEIRGEHYVEGDPGFVDPDAADFHLEAASPAVNACICSEGIGIDYDGETRPQGPKCDIGADEAP